MKRVNWAVLSGFVVLLAMILGGISLLGGGLYVGKHEGDTLHLLEVLLRMQAGERAHLDFMTPIGVLAFLPIALLMKTGLGVGSAILWAQALVAGLLLPPTIWVAGSRFRGPWAFLFAASVLVLVLALGYGEAERTVSISMHYNRWAWAVAFLVVAVSMLDTGRAPLPDGLILGLGLAALALIKVTYFVAFAPAVAVALLIRRDMAALGVTLVAGLAVAALVTLAWGPGYWLAYLGDLAAVAGSQIRPDAGLDLAGVLGGPAYMVGNMLAFVGVILLRRAGRAEPGLLLLLLVPGFIYVTYQNYGNDPQWWLLAGLLLMMLRPGAGEEGGGADLRAPIGWVAVALMALSAPSYTNMAWSPFRHAAVDRSTYVPFLPGSGVNEDLFIPRVRALRFDVKEAADGPGQPFAAWADREMRAEPDVLAGETLPECNLELGSVGWFAAIAEELNAHGLKADETVFAADLLSSFWLYGAGRPIVGAAPWYYGGLTGFEDADYVLVPLCPMAGKVRTIVLGELAERGVGLSEVYRTPIYILLEPES